jgi:hypothetical protein
MIVKILLSFFINSIFNESKAGTTFTFYNYFMWEFQLFVVSLFIYIYIFIVINVR